jgi:hypothetical protein
MDYSAGVYAYVDGPYQGCQRCPVVPHEWALVVEWKYGYQGQGEPAEEVDILDGLGMAHECTQAVALVIDVPQLRPISDRSRPNRFPQC